MLSREAADTRKPAAIGTTVATVRIAKLLREASDWQQVVPEALEILAHSWTATVASSSA